MLYNGYILQLYISINYPICLIILYILIVFRTFLKESFKRLLLTDLRFCEIENVEQHFWKILFYSVIELIRKLMTEQPDAKECYKKALLSVIQEVDTCFSL